MDTFKVGEVVIMQNAEALFEMNGEECTVLATDQLVRSRGGDVYKNGYMVHTGARVMYCAPFQLRKKRPPATGLESILALFKPMPQREGVAA
jgi:hypothetical protein